MSDIAIKFENISKQYRLGTIGTGTITHDLNRWWYRIRGKEDPYLMIGETNDRSAKASSDYVWALKDITFDIKQGEVVGIIGKNGAGKSTLLKILSRVTSPTTGSIKAKGRIASLLEVGTGFHPELTGRENIYMNGSIMGMSKAEITRKLDEIIDFAGVEKYIDTPSKRYSSGMTVRLGFAIAAHLEPEILVVDEVLAVGDAEFQRKAIGKMQDVSRGEGRTVLFVSHNMGAVKALCKTGVILKNGMVHATGEINDVVSQYMSINRVASNFALKDRIIDKDKQKTYFSDIQLQVEDEEMGGKLVPTGSSVQFIIDIESTEQLDNPILYFSIYNQQEVRFLHTSTFITLDQKFVLKKGANRIICKFNTLPFQMDSYYVNVALSDYSGRSVDKAEQALEFDVVENNIHNTGKIQGRDQGLIILPNKWELL